MKQIISESAYFGVLVSLLSYFLGVKLKKRFKLAILNPILIAVVLTIAALLLMRVPYESYNQSAKWLNYLLTPATVSLAIPLYEQLQILKKNLRAVLAGIIAGVLTSLVCVLLIALIFALNHAQYATLLPKSITTAIGMVLSQEMGGNGAIAAAIIIITGIVGNTFAEGFLKLIHVSEPVAKGIAIGTSSHAIGTSRAMELGEIEGAMSSLSIAIAGMITVLFAFLFGRFI